MEKLLTGKLCVVTGAARGMGRSLAIKYAEHGANVALIDLNKEGLEMAAKEVEAKGVQALPLVMDVAAAQEIDSAIRAIESKFIKIDVLANCAGISTSRLLVDVEEAEWDKVLNINLKAVYLLSRRAARNMIQNKVQNGKIVSISSQASKIGEFGNGVYCISKAGLNMLTQILGLELAEYGIAVTAVCPGYVNTEMVQQVFRKRGPLEGMTPEEYEKTLTNTVPMKRMAEPEEIADLMVYLSSGKANYITGVSVTIAGGRTLI
ncbi:SDR family NAD(P)-dependent oxidoreductase [Acetonema longum]|uniref:Short-chain dehydrogenase/reductase SDR n=1 Tax=Acetonema longum DSM 6540 TaxID=1009370 RepID=F7NLS6_9FIRM|nr:SDR family oxidoreductase [Acetonema longum]EGO63017.1 short-chain dehydrogenase/reductase SDR [Acetonema longum DSM 6540]